MKRLAATVLSILFLAMPALFGAVAQAQEQPRLRVDLDQLNPRVVTTTSTSLTITGRVTNIGDRRISKLGVRLQLGTRLQTEQQISDVLGGGKFKDLSATDFVDLAPDTLEPGQSAGLNLAVPLGQSSKLQFPRPGVYPLLVNVNGTPDFGGPERLAAVSLLMPVLGVPGKPPASRPPSAPSTSLLWPIANSTVHVVSSPLGGPLTLSDERLAGELGSGGRLDSLVAAARAAEADTKVSSSLCLAIDPDLVATVDAMTRGYQVATGSGPVPGKGVDTAKNWLGQLKALVAGRCVVTLPFADADLTALTKVRAGDATDTALLTSGIGGAATIKNLLGIQPQDGVLWPGGALDSQTVEAIGKAGVKTVLTDSGKLQSDSPPSGVVSIEGTDLRAQPIDALIASALDGSMSTQNGLGAIAFRTGLGGQTAGQERTRLLIAPPRHWNQTTPELTTFLGRMGDFYAAGLAKSTPLPDLLGESPSGTATVNYDPQDLTAATSGEVTAKMSQIDNETLGLSSAMTMDATKRVNPADVIAPVRLALIRAASLSWNGADAGVVTGNARGELEAIRSQVTVERPKQTIALASGASPLPAYITNGLPVGVNVRTVLKNNVGLRPTEAVPERTVPAYGAVNQLIPVEALRAGRFSVDVTLTTPDGTRLGSDARFELTSTEYGAITIIITLTAAGALLLLSSRRIYRRIKDARADRASETTPRVTEDAQV
ncbi:DUF6049 family protein [Amycolatopsis regifaucium]|uniref:Glycoprotein n=1 Tax=Amycolatopsis regifaucium TaxID=546365 RepID=A0A154MKI1_9PSEU|nr:DUF6049 family protein [Amycolatopsis regifaucium]KZB84904.1 glycoprotein [Amycolatopsis regifaucium]OKA03922.1 glycoprotein [Amycolatopsis regifaucium]SFI00568.1 hypothetical protein SAMN04489731_107400 [Amycolatopsis regifaucium]